VRFYIFARNYRCYLVAISDGSSGVDEPWNQFIFFSNLVKKRKTGGDQTMGAVATL
jgi:hypothetical protein